MRVVFAGTPEFAARALDAIAAAGHQVVLVLTRIDQPAGRGQASARKPGQAAGARATASPIAQPRSLRDAALQAQLRALDADAMVVAAYGLILPKPMLEAPRRGCLNIHASLLPRWRGAAPIQRAIEAGDTETGITVMQMDEGLDTGPMLLAEREPIGPEDTGGSLHDRLAALGARGDRRGARAAARDGTLAAQPQAAAGVTYAHKLSRADASIDWSAPARRIVDRVRAFDPVPGATTALERLPDAPIKLWSAGVAGRRGVGTGVPATTRLAAAEPAGALALRAGTVAAGDVAAGRWASG